MKIYAVTTKITPINSIVRIVSVVHGPNVLRCSKTNPKAMSPTPEIFPGERPSKRKSWGRFLHRSQLLEKDTMNLLKVRPTRPEVLTITGSSEVADQNWEERRLEHRYLHPEKAVMMTCQVTVIVTW